MNAEIIDPEYCWKQAASQEAVDYGAVQRSFMDQSYGVVANKAKILFQEPFRLGFEIVNRNEKATKMVGIFAFRVNKKLLYVPTFFVNGEIKAADMLYRADVKRFVPLTEDWCAYLVRGVEENSGEVVSRNRQRQPDAYMDRLAYPQRVKYASDMSFEDTEMEEARAAFTKSAQDGTLYTELMLHCADDTPLRKLLPLVIEENGPEALEKLASFVEGSAVAERYLVTHYTKEELENVSAWMAKEASAPLPAIAIVTDPALTKSASAKSRVFDRGYDLIDSRPAGSTNVVVEELESESIKELSSPGKVSVLLNNGEMENAYLFRCDRELLSPDPYSGDPIMCSSYSDRARPEFVYFPAQKELLRLTDAQEVFGDELTDWETAPEKLIDAKSLSVGKCYVAYSSETQTISELFYLQDRNKDGASVCLTTVSGHGYERKVFYAAGRRAAQGNYISDETKFLEIKCDVEREDDDIDCLKAVCSKALMSSIGLDQWMRTAGGLTTSSDVTVRSKDKLTFDVEHREGGTLLKVARNLGMLEAHLMLAEDFSLTTDKAGEILDKAVDKDVSYRVYDSITKSAYLTRAQDMEDWIESFDPDLNVRLDAPQYQILSTYTPRRPDQESRYGDVYQRIPVTIEKSASALLPMDTVMSQSPEELAQMSEMYDLPHIFDHQCVGRMATTSHNVVDQIKKYIPDLETGVDRNYRILFLLRYRPSDFEEIYGKDDLVDFEDNLTELASRAGEQLLLMLQRFEPDQYSAQDN